MHWVMAKGVLCVDTIKKRSTMFTSTLQIKDELYKCSYHVNHVICPL